MLFLYRVQNDPFETSSFNAVELDDSRLSAFALALSCLLYSPSSSTTPSSLASFRQAYHLRVRKPDPQFGYVWKDVHSDREFDQQLEGDTVLVRLVRLQSLELSNTKTPPRLVGGGAVLSAVAASIPKPPQQASEKRAAPPPPHQPVPAKKPAPVVDDGYSAEERAQRRIEERTKQEEQDQANRVQEVRSAEQQSLSQADAREQAWQALRAGLERWSNNTAGGEKKPVRALLSTLHTVLWEGSRWTPSALLVRPNEVRLAFRKAMLVVHPDKIPTSSPANVQVIAKYCFECLNTAYDKFEQTELK